jgi:hypothetical protein
MPPQPPPGFRYVPRLSAAADRRFMIGARPLSPAVPPAAPPPAVPKFPQPLAPEATDAASTQELANSLRAALIALGLGE